MIKKAIIAAAGNGTRFLPVTKAYPKELLPIWDKPAIHLLVEELVNAGIEQILIVHRHGNNLIKRYFSPDPDLNKFLNRVGKASLLEGWKNLKANLFFRPQPQHLPYGTGTPVLMSKTFIGHDPFVYLYGDDLILEPKSGEYISQLISSFERYQALAVFGAQEVPWDEVQRYGSIRYRKESKIPYQIETVEEALTKEKAPSNLVQFGRFVVSPKVIEVLTRQALSFNHELFFTDAMNTLAHQGVVIAQPIKKGKWLTIGDPQRWLNTNLEFQKFIDRKTV